MPVEIDIGNADEARDRLLSVLAEGPTMLVVDMGATTFCDSAGVNALVRVYQRALAAEAALRLVITARVVQRVLAITGVDRLLDIYPTIEDALAAPGDPAAPGETDTEQAPPGQAALD
jgi:anti-anti-sigma factor